MASKKKKNTDNTDFDFDFDLDEEEDAPEVLMAIPEPTIVSQPEPEPVPEPAQEPVPPLMIEPVPAPVAPEPVAPPPLEQGPALLAPAFAEPPALAAEPAAPAPAPDVAPPAPKKPKQRPKPEPKKEPKTEEQPKPQIKVMESSAARAAKRGPKKQRKQSGSLRGLSCLVVGLGMFLVLLAAGAWVGLRMLQDKPEWKHWLVENPTARNWLQGPAILNFLANQYDDVESMLLLADSALARSPYMRPDPEGLRYLRRAADWGDATAAYRYGELQWYGQTGGDWEKTSANTPGLDYILRSAEQGSADGAALWGMILLRQGKTDEAAGFLLAAAQKGSSLGAEALCSSLPASIIAQNMLRDKAEPGEDPPSLASFLERAVRRGKPTADACITLAYYTYHGLHGLQQDKSGARALLSRVESAQPAYYACSIFGITSLDALLDGRKTLYYALMAGADYDDGDAAAAARWAVMARDAEKTADSTPQYNYVMGVFARDGAAGQPKDPRQAKRLFAAAANGGCVQALVETALMLQNGEGGSKDPHGAYEFFRNAHDQSATNNDAAIGLGKCLWYGSGTDKDVSGAFACLSGADCSDDAEAQYILGCMYYNGLGTERDEDQGRQCIEASAATGYPDACEMLGMLYLNSPDADMAVATEYLDKSAASGSARANYLMGTTALQSGSHARAASYFNKAMSVPEAMRELGKLYYDGKGVTQSYPEAARLLLASEAVLDQPARNMLIKLCWNGQGMPRDYRKAAELARITQSTSDPELLCILADMQCFGRGGFPRAYDEGLAALRRQASNRLPLAAALLGRALYYGPTDALRNEALSYLETAALTENHIALAMLGTAYHEGRIRPRDDAKAAEYLNRAADRGNIDARWLIGSMYLTGNGMRRNTGTALNMLRRAAEAGQTDAALQLARLYVDGTAVPRNLDDAAKYLQQPLQDGTPDALCLHARIALLTPNLDAAAKNEALRQLHAAADAGSTDAQTYLGRAYMTGGDVPRDPARARSLLRAALDNGNTQAGAAMLDLLQTTGAPRSELDAVLARLTDAARTDPHAYALLGLAYSKTGPLRNDAKALEYFRKAADADDPEGTYWLGRLELERTRGAAGAEQAAAILERAAALDWGPAMEYLGMQLVPGGLLPTDLRRAASLLTGALRFSSLSPQGYARLGAMALAGDGLARDPRLAAHYLDQAARAGVAAAAGQLALAYVAGTDLPADLPRAAEYAQLAMAANEPAGFLAAARIALAPDNGTPDAAEAIRLLTIAADGGNADAQYELARVYLDGKITHRDAVRGERYMKMAAENGHPAATPQRRRARR